MPRFFINIDDGDFHHHDNDGHDLFGLDAVRTAAVAALLDMVKMNIGESSHRTFVVTVWDDQGNRTYNASLCFSSRWEADVMQVCSAFDNASWM